MRILLSAGSFGLVCALLGSVASTARAQQESYTLSVDSKLVLVPVIVHDKKGALVSDLKREDFALTVDGVAQPIRYFDHDANAPLTVGLLVDTSMSQRDVIDDERTASVAFIQKMLSPERDKAFVIQFAANVDLLADITSSRPKLQEALQQLDVAAPRFDNQGGGNSGGGYGQHGGHGSSGRGGGTALYDSIFLASDEVLNKTKERRVLILLTDGVDNGSRETLVKSIEAAQRANTVVYAIYYKGEEHGGGWGHGFPGGGGIPGMGGGHGHPFADGQGPGGHGGGNHDVDGKKILERICGETGGRVFEVSKKQTVEKIYEQIGAELRSQFRLGFTPSAQGASEGYHQLEVSLTGELAKSKDTIQGRDGYYTKVAEAR